MKVSKILAARYISYEQRAVYGQINIYMAGVNHFSLHCRLVKFRGLIKKGEGNTALRLVGRKRIFLYMPSMNFQVMGNFKPITAPYFPFSSNQGISPNDSVNYSG